MAPLKRIVLSATASLSGVIVFLLFVEAILAVTHFNTKSYIRFVPELGAGYVPHAYYRYTKEGFSEGHFNAHGFRDYDRTYAKPDRTFRILVLGDSYVEGLQVALAKTFPALLERRLNERSSPVKFEVLNLGQSGFGTADEHVRYIEIGVKYSPDIVILAFLTGNDFRNNSRILNREEIGFYFTFDMAGHLILDRSLIDDYEMTITIPKRIFQFLKYRSYLVSLISERLFLLRQELRERRLERRLANSEQDRDQQKLTELSDFNIYLPI